MDEAAFDAFYLHSFGRLVGQIYAMCGSITEAQDCVQEAFVRAWDKRRTLDTDQHPEAWVRTVAYRLCVSRWRKTRRARLAPDRAHEPRPAAQPDIAQVALTPALQSLPADQRRAVALPWHGCWPTKPPQPSLPRLHRSATMDDQDFYEGFGDLVRYGEDQTNPPPVEQIRTLGNRRRGRRRTGIAAGTLAVVGLAAGVVFSQAGVVSTQAPNPATQPPSAALPARPAHPLLLRARQSHRRRRSGR